MDLKKYAVNYEDQFPFSLLLLLIIKTDILFFKGCLKSQAVYLFCSSYRSVNRPSPNNSTSDLMFTCCLGQISSLKKDLRTKIVVKDHLGKEEVKHCKLNKFVLLATMAGVEM